MNLDLKTYTPLESLLLFQSLATYGVDAPSFSRISDLLKKNPHINSHERYQSGRLSPDALRNFYSHLLKEQVKLERQNGAADGESQKGEVKNAKKRKAPSPSLPTVQEAAQDSSLIPKLVENLYATYRRALTKQIREDEQRYERLQKDLQAIERGDWDQHLKEKANRKSPVSRSPNLPKKSPLLAQSQLPASSQPGVLDVPQNTTSLANARPPDGIPQQHGLVAPNGQPAKTTISTSPQKKKKQTTPAPSTPQPAPESVPHQQTRTPQVAPPRFVPTQQADVTPNGQSPHTHRSPYPPPGAQPYTQLPLGVSNSHAPNQVNTPQLPRLSPVPHNPSASPFQPPPIQPYGANGVPQHGTPGPVPLYPSSQRLPGPPHNSIPSNVQTPQQQRNVYPPVPGQLLYQPPPQGSYMLPPFQVSPQDPTRAQPQPVLPQYHEVSTPVTNRPPTSYSGPPTAASTRPGFPPIYPPTNQGRPSFGSPLGMRTPQNGIQTPRSAKTMWKPSAKVVATPPAPRPEVSPIDDLSPPKLSKQGQQKAKVTRKSRTRGKAKEKEQEAETEEVQEQIEDPAPEPDARQSRSRRKAPTKRVRPGSIASSQAGGSVRERSRSHSIISHTETVAADNESQAGHRVKSERGTSVDMIDEDPAGTPSQTSTRRRAAANKRATGKRKRDNREPSIAESDDRRTTPGLPRTVVAQRQFAKTCAQMMDGIESHKHASIFADKVKAKDAEGYYDIIKRPTSLKEIRKAINVGTKAIASAVSDTPAASPGGSGGFVELPLTPDLVPPKAIVNSGQLERELMRMFVNAVMFNPGEGGVVGDAREMSETAQSQISIWRNINHQGRGLEIEETPPVGVATPGEEENVLPAGKRRKQ